MASKIQFNFDTARTLAFGSISGTYASIGTPTTHPAVQLIFFNQTNVPLFFSNNATNDMVPVAAGQVIPIVCSVTGQNPGSPSPMSVAAQWSVRSIGTAGSGAAYFNIAYLT